MESPPLYAVASIADLTAPRKRGSIATAVYNIQSLARNFLVIAPLATLLTTDKGRTTNHSFHPSCSCQSTIR